MDELDQLGKAYAEKKMKVMEKHPDIKVEWCIADAYKCGWVARSEKAEGLKRKNDYLIDIILKTMPKEYFDKLMKAYNLQHNSSQELSDIQKELHQLMLKKNSRQNRIGKAVRTISKLTELQKAKNQSELING